MLAELNAIPDVMIRAWLKDLDLPRSGDVIERIEALKLSGRLSDAQIQGFIRDMRENGRKHVFLYSLPEEEWTRVGNLESINDICNAFAQDANKVQILGLNTSDKRMDGRKLLISMSKVIRVPKIDKERRITYNNAEWAAIVFMDVSVSIVFEIDPVHKMLNVRFDAVKDMGAEKNVILHQCRRFLTDILGLNGLQSMALGGLARRVEAENRGTVFEIIAKVETENEDGDTITGTIRMVRDDNRQGSASELPGGHALIHGGNDDILLDLYNIVWLASESSEELTRNIRTTIYSDTGEVYFRHHAFEREMVYVLSCIREFTR